MADQWEQINNTGGGGSREDIQTWNFREEGEGATFIGTLLEVKHINKGEDHYVLRIFDTKEGKRQIWNGTKVLDDNLGKLAIGDKVKIVYNGKVQSQKNKAQRFHSFDIFVARGKTAKPAEKSEEVDVDDIPF